MIPFGPGFVMHNTHSLPTNSANIVVDLGQLFGAIAAMPLPVRTLTPSHRYLGDMSAGTFSMARYNSVQSIVANHVDASVAVLGFAGSPRYVEPQIGPGDATDWPFFYEDKRNQFYVSMQSAFVPYQLWDGFGALTAAASAVAGIPYIPPLTTNQFPVAIGPDPALDGSIPNEAAGAAWNFAGSGRNLVAGFVNQASFSFQGRTIGIAGGIPGLSPATTTQTQRG